VERREETPLRSALDVPRCLNCGAALAGQYCAACGQHVRSERLSLGHVARQAAGELSPVDHGIVFTALAVLTRPGRMAREYVEGRTVRYVGPVKYFMLLVGAAQILALRYGMLDALVSGFLAGWYEYERQGVPNRAQAAAVAFVTRYFVSLSAAGVPLFAAATRALFRRARLNYAEHLVLALYTGAQQIALFTLVGWILDVTHVRGPELVYVPLAFAYQVWALREFTGASWARTAWRTLVAAVLSMFATVTLIAILYALLSGRA